MMKSDPKLKITSSEHCNVPKKDRNSQQFIFKKSQSEWKTIFAKGERVIVQNPKTMKWNQRAVIIHKNPKRNSYVIRMENGKITRRNARKIILDTLPKSKEQKQIPNEPIQPRRSPRNHKSS